MSGVRLAAAIITLLGAGCGGCEEPDPGSTTDASITPIQLNPKLNSIQQPLSPPVFRVIQSVDVPDPEVRDAIKIIMRVERRLIHKVKGEDGEEGFFVTPKGVYYGIGCDIGDTKEGAISQAVDEASKNVDEGIPEHLIHVYLAIDAETQTVDMGTVACAKAVATVMEKETR